MALPPFGTLVRDARTRLGLRQREVCEAAGLDEPRLSRLEHGKANPTSRELAALVRVLDLDPAAALAAVETAWPAESGVEVAA